MVCLFVCLFVFVDASLQPYLDQINQIEEQVTALEQAAYKLDTYSKKLGEFNLLRVCTWRIMSYVRMRKRVYKMLPLGGADLHSGHS